MSPSGQCVYRIWRENISGIHARITQRAFKRETVHLVVKRKDDPAAVRVLHLNVAALAMNFDEAQALQGGDYLPAGEQRQLHKVKATTS